MTIEELATKALSLPSESRALLAEQLVESLDVSAPASRLKAKRKPLGAMPKWRLILPSVFRWKYSIAASPIVATDADQPPFAH